jgi:hypothetical protein
LATGRKHDSFYGFKESVSPNGRYLLFRRILAKPEEFHVGSVLLLYDTSKSAERNRAPSASPEWFYKDAGIPVFPDYFRFNGVYIVPENSGEGGGELVSDDIVWADSNRAVFGYLRNGQVSLVMLTINDAGQVIQSSERPIDAVPLFFYRDPEVTAANRLRIEHIEVRSVTSASVSVRLTFVKGANPRTLDLDLP